MRQHLVLVLVPGLLYFSFGCGALGDDDEGAARQEPSSSETYEAPLGGTDTDRPAAGAGGGRVRSVTDLEGAPALAKPASPGESGDTPSTPDAPPPPPPAQPDPGPPPTTTCSVQKDADGFFWRTSSNSSYVAYVPASYSSSTPMRVVVGLHGCGDDAHNFATWGVNPWATRATQEHIGISVSGETGSNHCWSMGADDDKVLAAVEDLATCFWVDRNKVVVAGFSSGGQLAYRVGMMQASSFAGILIENSGLYAAGSTPAALLAGASWKIRVAHRAHSSDSVFPIAKVKTDWQSMSSAGFPVSTSEVAGGHDGTSDDWANWLLPQSASWTRP